MIYLLPFERPTLTNSHGNNMQSFVCCNYVLKKVNSWLFYGKVPCSSFMKCKTCTNISVLSIKVHENK